MGWWGACGTSVQKHKQSGVLKLIEAVKPHNRLPDKHVNITVVNKSQFHTNDEAARARQLVKWPLEQIKIDTRHPYRRTLYGLPFFKWGGGHPFGGAVGAQTRGLGAILFTLHAETKKANYGQGKGNVLVAIVELRI